jgi:hypothetical protein
MIVANSEGAIHDKEFFKGTVDGVETSFRFTGQEYRNPTRWATWLFLSRDNSALVHQRREPLTV